MNKLQTTFSRLLGKVQNANTPKYIIVHCSAISTKVSNNQFVSINNNHKQRDFPMSSLGYYIGYHYLLTNDREYQCRLDTDEGAHCNQSRDGLSINFQSIGICWSGDGDNEMPSENYRQLLQKRIWAIQDKYNIPNWNVYYHHFFAINKTCAGTMLNNQYLADLLKRPSNPQLTEPCVSANDVIIKQQEQISVLQKVIDYLSSLIK